MERPLILISNDDGYQAKGIQQLVDMVHDMGDIIVCAPEGPRSGRSRAFSMKDITLRQIDADGMTLYACSGTPVDCVKMAYALKCPRKPDLVLGGINHGDNASTNAHYSGTIGVVFEGCMKGIPSIAFSLCDYAEDANFEPMRPIVRELCAHVLKNGLPHYTCLNVNVPKVEKYEDLKGVRVCRMANGRWRQEVALQDGSVDEYNNPIYRYLGYYKNDEPKAGDTDAWALSNGFAAITPCTIDITDHSVLSSFSDLFNK